MVINVSCKCSLLPHKVRETFLVLSEKNNIFMLKPRYIWTPSFPSAFSTCCVAVPQSAFGLLLRGQAQWINVAVLLLLFLLKGQKEIRVKELFLRLIVNKRFQRLYQDQLHFDILYTWRVNNTNTVDFEFVLCTLSLKSWGCYAKHGFFNTFSGDLYFDALNSGLFQICAIKNVLKF